MVKLQAKKIIEEVSSFLPATLRAEVAALPVPLLEELEEIRLRQDAPFILGLKERDIFLAAGGGWTGEIASARILSPDEIRQAVLLLSESSFYALEEELRRGYLTLPGGHRAGLCGRTVLANGRIKTLKDISSLNIRIAHQVKGAAEKILPYLLTSSSGCLGHTLIASPPRAGKTTLLRDMAYLLSEGSKLLPPLNVGIVDERSEIAAMLHGSPQMQVGTRCDVLDSCPKAEGILMMIRSMSPQVIICDEIGSKEDAYAINEAINAGVRVVVSAHAGDNDEILRRPVLGELVRDKAFDRLVVLSRRKGPGTVEQITDGYLHVIEYEEPLC